MEDNNKKNEIEYDDIFEEEIENDLVDEVDSLEDKITARTLHIKQLDRFVKDIIVDINEGQIFLNPDYQRNYVWNNNRASTFIESLIMNIPIPPIYAAEENIVWNVVDGVQRLISLSNFYSGKSKLANLNILKELNGKKYDQLPEKAKRALDMGELRLILILESSSPEIQYEVFERLNQGSAVLNQQELRNCLYRGDFNNLLKNDLIENTNFKNIFNLTVKHKRMADVESILRFFSLHDSFNFSILKIENYDGRIKNIMNSYMKKKTQEENLKLDYYRSLFEETILKVYLIFGKQAFRRYNYAKINKPLFDAVMCSFTQFSTESLLMKKEEIIEVTNYLTSEDELFIDAITTATGNTANVDYRISTYYKALKDLINV